MHRCDNGELRVRLDAAPASELPPFPPPPPPPSSPAAVEVRPEAAQVVPSASRDGLLSHADYCVSPASSLRRRKVAAPPVFLSAIVSKLSLPFVRFYFRFQK